MTTTRKSLQWFVGGDPGKGGGFAAVSLDRTEVAWCLMTKTRQEVIYWLDRFIVLETVVLIEKVWSSPQMGVSSAFTFGMMYERQWALVAAKGFPRDEVTPQVWQSGLGIPPRKKKKAKAKVKGKRSKTEWIETKPQFKNRLLRKAKQLFPGLDLWQRNLSVQKAICDALLIAEFCRRREIGR